MSDKPSKIYHIQHLLHRHRLRVIAVIITLVGLIGLFIASVIFFPSSDYSEEPTTAITEPDYLIAHDTLSTTIPNELQPVTAEAITVATTPLTEENLIPVTVKKGQSLATIFKNLNISQQQLLQLTKLPGVKKQIRGLRQGKVLEFGIDGQQQLQTLIIPISGTQKLTITRTPTGFVENTISEKINISTKLATMTLTSSFYVDGQKANIPLGVLNNYLNIFKWSVDFQHDVHPGDKMSMLYDVIKNERTHKTDVGDILVASYTHNNKTIYAIRYNGADRQPDYFDQNGNSLHKAFRRDPLDIGYVSSPFNLHRLHPILGYVRPHLGTDFAAPYGTPIHATGDGRIILQGRKGGYGRCIMISHGNGIVTLYGHMSRFASQFKQGSYVKMGQVIGYIGTSGLANGPHVHYEFRLNKQFKNPMTVVLPNGVSISTKTKSTYLTYAKQEIALLPGSAPAPAVSTKTATQNAAALRLKARHNNSKK